MTDAFFSLSLLFPVYDTVQESWTRPHTGHTDLPERRRACEWPNTYATHTHTHRTHRTHFRVMLRKTCCHLGSSWWASTQPPMHTLFHTFLANCPPVDPFAEEPIYCTLWVSFRQRQVSTEVREQQVITDWMRLYYCFIIVCFLPFSGLTVSSHAGYYSIWGETLIIQVDKVAQQKMIQRRMRQLPILK